MVPSASNALTRLRCGNSMITEGKASHPLSSAGAQLVTGKAMPHRLASSHLEHFQGGCVGRWTPNAQLLQRFHQRGLGISRGRPREVLLRCCFEQFQRLPRAQAQQNCLLLSCTGPLHLLL